MSLARVLVVVLSVLLPLTACLVLATGDVLLPHPWHKHADGASHATLRLPSGVASATSVFMPLALLGPLVVSVSPVAATITLQPPFVPPRA